MPYKSHRNKQVTRYCKRITDIIMKNFLTCSHVLQVTEEHHELYDRIKYIKCQTFKLVLAKFSTTICLNGILWKKTC